MMNNIECLLQRNSSFPHHGCHPIMQMSCSWVQYLIPCLGEEKIKEYKKEKRNSGTEKVKNVFFTSTHLIDLHMFLYQNF